MCQCLGQTGIICSLHDGTVHLELLLGQCDHILVHPTQSPCSSQKRERSAVNKKNTLRMHRPKGEVSVRCTTSSGFVNTTSLAASLVPETLCSFLGSDQSRLAKEDDCQ